MAVQTNADVAAKVRGALAEKQFNASQIAASLNLSKMSMSRRMRGETPFTPEELIIISGEIQVPVASFFGEVGV